MFGGDQVVVDQVGVWFGMWGEDDDDVVDVGCYWFEQFVYVWVVQFGVVW